MVAQRPGGRSETNVVADHGSRIVLSTIAMIFLPAV